VEAQLISAFSDLKQWPTGCEKNGTTADEQSKKKTCFPHQITGLNFKSHLHLEYILLLFLAGEHITVGTKY